MSGAACGLKRERQVEQYERIGVPTQGYGGGVDGYPDSHQDCLADEELRRPEEPCESLGAPAEHISAKGTVHRR